MSRCDSNGRDASSRAGLGMGGRLWRRSACLALVTFFIAGAASAQTVAQPARAPAGKTDRIQQLSFYPDALTRPIEDKVTVGGVEVLDRALKTNLDYGQNVRPINAAPDHPLIATVREVLRDLPAPIHQLASRYVVAVYLLEDDWGTGTTEGVQDGNGAWKYSYITLNLTALTRTANSWAAWKENSAFRPRPGFGVAVTIEPSDGDTVQNAIQFILLHELGHAIGLGMGVHGFWDDKGLPPATRNSAFVKLSWEPDGKGWLISRYAKKFPLLVQARFYRFDQAPLVLSDAGAVYQDLSRTNLPSLYGITNVYDDFAETFAVYVHTQLLGRPYRVDVSGSALSHYTYVSCIVAHTCPEKVRLLESLLKLK